MTALVLVVPVLHDEAAGEQGTRAAYQRGCRCPECRAANAAATAKSRRSPRGYVPVGRVRSHLEAMVDSGLRQSEIARLSGVTEMTVHRLLAGKVKNCTPDTRSRLLAVTPNTSYISETTEVEVDDPLAVLRLLLDPEALAWKADADCARLAITPRERQRWFFPTRGDSAVEAVTICGGCPVWRQCLQFALDTFETEGVWGRAAATWRRKIAHHQITVDELGAAGMNDDPTLAVTVAIDRVLEQRAAVELAAEVSA